MRDQIEALRRCRRQPTEDASITANLREMVAEARRRASAAADAESVWRALSPPTLVAGVVVVGAVRGVLRLRPTSSSARYALRAWLASGGEAALAATCPLVKRVVIAR